MSLQIQIQKTLSQYNFLESSVYEKHDLTNQLKKEDRFVVRQGDLVITNYKIFDRRKRGLRIAWAEKKNGIWKYMGSHIVIPLQNKTVLLHNEHGITIIPRNYHELEFYTFNEAGD